MQLILYRLKTGCQWRLLPVDAFLDARQLSWQGVYHHWRAWIEDGSLRRMWVALLAMHKCLLDCSVLQLDGSHSPMKKQGPARGYQNRKAGFTTNSLYLTDSQGLPLALATPQAGQHNDLYEIAALITELNTLLSEAGINVAGCFLNADAGFDAQVVRTTCEAAGIEANIPRQQRRGKHENQDVHYVYFDEELYRKRIVIERTNAWPDGFKTLIMRYETKINTWMVDHYLTFAVILLRKVLKC